MKKTMFITSVIMVVVMAIALTTSSLAWFSASGAASVTTNAFQVSAESTTVEGLAISKNGAEGTWGNSITLTASGSDLKPLVPFTGASHYVEDGENPGTYIWDFDENDFRATFVSYDSEQDKWGAWNVSMKGNKLGNNSIYNGTAYTDGYFVDDFYITNTANGANAAAVLLNCTIDFYTPEGYKYTNGENETDQGRAENLYSLDATLNVAVFYALNRFEADDDDDDSDDADDDTWQLLAFASSKGAASVNLGRTEETFASGQAAGSSVGPWTYTANLSNHTRYTEDTAKNAIRPDRTLAGNPVTRDKMMIKVVAWYDGPSLINNNAADANLKFGLTFGKTASSNWNKTNWTAWN